MEELNKQNRRNFIKNSGVLLAGAALVASPISHLVASNTQTKLCVLHTNDWHSRIEPFDKTDKNNAGMGGAEFRAALIKKYRSENEHVLLLDAGDIFQGTPYFNFYGGELEYKLMSQMGYDCVTLGNHDFDNGIEGIFKQMPHATFDFVNCNYDFTDTLIENKVLPFACSMYWVILVIIKIINLRPFGELLQQSIVDSINLYFYKGRQNLQSQKLLY